MNTKLMITAPIQAPSAEVLAELAKHMETADGALHYWDAARQVLLTAIVRDGVLVNWYLEPALNRAEAEARRDQSARETIKCLALLTTLLPPATREALLRDLGQHFGAAAIRAAH